MAASSNKIGSYQCEFVDPVSEDLFVCKICKHVARNPNLTSCCTETFCKACIMQVLEDRQPCPSCEESEFTILLNVKYQRRILALQVHCTMKDRGCEWIGKLESLNTHLEANTGDCEYVDVECPKECDQPVQRHMLSNHLANLCPKRDFTCQHCNFKSTYEVVCNQHWPAECKHYPVPCPNACGIGAVERGDLEDHLKMCSLQVVDCEFSHAGCEEKVLYEDMERHMQENTQKHLVLMSAMSLRISRELQEQQREFQGYLKRKEREREEFEKKLHEKEKQIKAVEEQVQKKDKQIMEFQQQVEEYSNLTLDLTIPNFSQHMMDNTSWDSPPLYTHPCGYKFRIRVWANGFMQSTHVSVYFRTVKGEFDDQLKWPAQCTITLQVLNQTGDREHFTVARGYEWNKPTDEQDHFFHFIPHSDLEFNPQEQTKFLRDDDSLVFRIVKIELHL